MVLNTCNNSDVDLFYSPIVMIVNIYFVQFSLITIYYIKLYYNNVLPKILLT